MVFQKCKLQKLILYTNKTNHNFVSSHEHAKLTIHTLLLNIELSFNESRKGRERYFELEVAAEHALNFKFKYRIM